MEYTREENVVSIDGVSISRISFIPYCYSYFIRRWISVALGKQGRNSTEAKYGPLVHILAFLDDNVIG